MSGLLLTRLSIRSIGWRYAEEGSRSMVVDLLRRGPLTWHRNRRKMELSNGDLVL
jgi:hypothetical protein